MIVAKLLTKCPACGDKLKIVSLQCSDCGMTLNGEFEPNLFETLDSKQVSFLITFLKCKGNLSALQSQLKISYPQAKKKLDNLLVALKLMEYVEPIKTEKEIVDVKNWFVRKDSNKASEIIKAKLKQCGGRTTITTFKGLEREVWVEPDGETFGCDGLHGHTHKFEIFDYVVDFLRSNNGGAKKGNAHFPLGSEKCGIDTVAGIIVKDYFGVQVGKSGFDPVFVVAAMLEWAGIAKNGRNWLELTEAYYQR